MPEILKVKLSDLAEVGVDSNLRAVVVDNYLVLVNDLEINLGLSSTGKSVAIASTGGFRPVLDDIKGSIWLVRKAE